MTKKVEVYDHINLLDEAYRLLYYWINIDDLDNKRIEFEENYQSDLEQYNRKFDVITKMYRYITDQLLEYKEQIEYYFKERNSSMSTLGALAILFNYHKYDNKLLTYQEHMKSFTEEEKIRLYALLINSDEAVNIPKEKLTTLSDLITFIEASPYENDAKWEAIKIFNNQETHYNKVYDILSKTISIFKNHFSDLLQEIGEKFYEYWNQFQQTNDIITLIRDRLHVTWNNNEVGTVVLPQVFDPLGIAISIDESDPYSKDVIRLSIILDKRLSKIKNKMKKVDIINFGKLLSDKSKVDILEYISKKPAYGKEIANELNLSTATISYHMNALSKLGFICEEVKSNKIYYSINKDKISNYLDEVKRFFVDL